ncbi:MAG: hypothetical protein M3O91_10985 [Chloroflexota bacterium]|nr:hypothetical protein [Chloroflexota bacterium]
MLLLAVVAVGTLAANGSRQLRHAAAALVAVSLAASAIAAGIAVSPQLAVAACGALVGAAVLYIAASDAAYGEAAGWRVWLATLVAAVATPVAFASFRSLSSETIDVPLLGADARGVAVEVAAFWLLASGIAILLSARSAVRMSIGAFLMVGGVQLLVRLTPGAHLGLTLLVSWLQVLISLAGAFLIVNERATREG